MTEQWQELKETITELRDNDGTGTQQEICKFLANYMDVLEKQMRRPTPEERESVEKYVKSISKPTGVDFWDLEQKPCEDAISREKAKQFLYERLDRLNDDELYDIFSRIIDDMYNELPSVRQEPKEDLDKIILTIHKTIARFLEHEKVLTDRDRFLLDVNKAICNSVRLLERNDKECLD